MTINISIKQVYTVYSMCNCPQLSKKSAESFALREMEDEAHDTKSKMLNHNESSREEVVGGKGQSMSIQEMI